MKPYYRSKGITIYHGDCRDVLPTLPKVDLVLTDPPYSLIAATGEWEATAGVAIGLYETARLVTATGAMLAFTTSSARGMQFTLGSVGKTLRFNRLLTWYKEGGGSFAAGPWHWDTVAILAFGRATFGGATSSSVFKTAAKYEKTSGHRAELPAGIAEWLFAPFDREGVVVLDSFCGTGRLLEPAAQRGRKAIGIEAEEKYCEIAARRLDALAGKARAA